MIAPLETPPARRTTHGAVMSPRLSRLYTWLDDNRIGLTDFSTDQCVERVLPRLRKLADELQAEIHARSVHPTATVPAYLVHLAADLAAIMRRLPSARVPARSGR